MGKGKKHESAAQERKNLLGINPIPDHASGSWMSKHSIASSGSMSPLHLKGFKGDESSTTSSTTEMTSKKKKSDFEKYRRDPNYSNMSTLEKMKHDFLGPSLGGRANWNLRRVGPGNYGKS